MGKSLIINCSLNRHAKIEELLKAIRKFSQCKSVEFRNIHDGYDMEKNTNAVILSGSRARIVNRSDREKFKETTDFVKHLDIPILGICYGYQLICWAFGCKVASLDESVEDIFEEVRVLKVDEIFEGFEENQTIRLAQSHNDYVMKNSLDSADLVLLADSPSCEVEAVKHKHVPLYGVQFHPERIKIKGQICLEGHKVIENFFKYVVKR